MSLRATNSERIRILKVVVAELARQVEDRTHVRVVDSSSDQYAGHVERIFEESSLSYDYRRDQLPLGPSIESGLQQAKCGYFFQQFDDMLATNLSSNFLEACTGFLKRWDGLVSVIIIPWAAKVATSTKSKEIRVKTYELDGDWFVFRDHRVKAIDIDHVNGFRFGIFANFQYGFSFQLLAAPVNDYRERLCWYLENLNTVSVHEIENRAARGLIGPSWKHIAIPLDDIAMLDLDYSHTPSATRPDCYDNQQRVAALESGWPITALSNVTDDKLQAHNHRLKSN